MEFLFFLLCLMQISAAISEMSEANKDLLEKYRKEVALRRKYHEQLVELKGMQGNNIQQRNQNLSFNWLLCFKATSACCAVWSLCWRRTSMRRASLWWWLQTPTTSPHSVCWIKERVASLKWTKFSTLRQHRKRCVNEQHVQEMLP